MILKVCKETIGDYLILSVFIDFKKHSGYSGYFQEVWARAWITIVQLNDVMLLSVSLWRQLLQLACSLPGSLPPTLPEQENQ